MCALLSVYLTETQRVSFILPGTHGIVYPWIPSLFLNTEIMRRLREALMHEMMVQFASSPSRTSSPASDTIDLNFEKTEPTDVRPDSITRAQW